MPIDPRLQPYHDVLVASESAARKLKASMDEGPDGQPCVLTPAEATIVLRALAPHYGVFKAALPNG